jgi:hypothetical protein
MSAPRSSRLRTVGPRMHAVRIGVAVSAALALGGALSGCYPATSSGASGGSSLPAASAPASEAASVPPAPSGTSASASAHVGGAPSSGTVKAASTGCASLVVTAAVKAAVTDAHRAWAHLVHIRPVSGGFYYGRCAGVEYAGSEFRPAPGATTQEKIALQDDGGTMMYYARHAGGPWRHIASSGFEPWLGCTKLPQIPHPLAVLWHDCPEVEEND